MRSNGLLKWLMIPLVCLLVFVGLRLSSHQQPSPATAAPPGSQRAPGEGHALVIEGEPPRDAAGTRSAPHKPASGASGTALAAG